MVTTFANQRDLVFTPLSLEERQRQTTVQSLATRISGPGATSPEEEASDQTLREMYLELYLAAQSQSKARTDTQARGTPAPPIQGSLIHLLAGETTDKEDNCFCLWVSSTRCFVSMYAWKASVSVFGVFLKPKLRYDNTKLRDRDQLCNRTRYASATTDVAVAGRSVSDNKPNYTTSGEKRPRSRDDWPRLLKTSSA
uniref:Uncharacterized protein n=1 Tax=Peronospora matthiolae TaxID=2874970 RepID=A0AAV1T4B7_9STRA